MDIGVRVHPADDELVRLAVRRRQPRDSPGIGARQAGRGGEGHPAGRAA